MDLKFYRQKLKSFFARNVMVFLIDLNEKNRASSQRDKVVNNHWVSQFMVIRIYERRVIGIWAT